MLDNKMWSIFKKTGNIEAYLYCKQSSQAPQLKGNQPITTQVQVLETTKINSL